VSQRSTLAVQPIAPAEEIRLRPPRSRAATTWRRFRRHKLAVASAVFMLVLALAAIFAPVVAGRSPYDLDMFNANGAPGAAHLLGTDAYGRDTWARLIFAARVSLSVGLVAVSIYTATGIVLGALSGYYGGWVDHAVMRFTDTVMSFPGLMIIILAVSILGPSIYNVMLVIGLLGWPATARLVRGEFLSLRERDFIQAARMVGLRDGAIIWKHLLPNALFPVIISSTLGVADAMLTEAGLSFLGLGVQAPLASWGNMLTDAQHLNVLQHYPWQWIPPGLAIAISVLAINFIGDGLRDALDPRAGLR
jgi:peptide/nickel transport system permease protein